MWRPWSQAEFEAMMCDAGFSNTSYENLTGGMVAIHSGFKEL
jgi:ubiquinone/menaquinone biosynthesis C-methylase UbiE